MMNRDSRILVALMMAGCLTGAFVFVETGCGISSIPGLNTPTPSGGTRGSERTPTPSSSPGPTPEPTPGVSECDVDSECDDGLFCNGEEFCQGGACRDGDSPCDETETCDENNDICTPGNSTTVCLSDVDCPADQSCDLANDVCVPLEGCGRGPCNIANSSPGCNNAQCCDDVCRFNPQCCLIQWDENCANVALSQSTCLQP